MSDIIAAIVTGAVESGVGIIRVSGQGAAALCNPLVKIKAPSLMEAVPRHMYLGGIYQGDRLLDEGLIVYMPGPHSYTAEDTVEFQCHGGPYLMQQVLQAVLQAGARLAEPGEFTKRAFLNGRLDLSQAEAVMKLIASQNEFGRKTALQQLRGETSSVLKKMREQLLEKTAYIEAALDDPEHLSLEGFAEGLQPEVAALQRQLQEMIRRSEDGKKLADGIETAIVGRPNVGKSSLLNALLGEERAIVTSVPGTTRDTLEEKLRLGELVLLLSDTAGIHASEDEVERIGIERARQKAQASELVLQVLDGSREPEADDLELLQAFGDKKRLLLVNKADLPLAVKPEELEKQTGVRTLLISARERRGLTELKEAIEELFALGELRQKESLVCSLRQKQDLEAAEQALGRVSESIEMGMPEDLFTVDLMDAYTALGRILGEEVEEDLVNEIFSKFCMGK